MIQRDDFNFNIVNFPFLSSNIPQSPAYGVYVSLLIRYARASSAYSDFLLLLRNFMAVIMISLENSNFRSLIWLLTCFSRLYFCNDMVLQAPFTARPLITYIDILVVHRIFFQISIKNYHFCTQAKLFVIVVKTVYKCTLYINQRTYPMGLFV